MIQCLSWHKYSGCEYITHYAITLEHRGEYKQPSRIICNALYGWMLPREVETVFD